MYVTVAVATGVEGYTSVALLWPALAFHAVVSALGMQALRGAAERADAAKPAESAVSEGALA